jgi:YHS domain-containing protein
MLVRVLEFLVGFMLVVSVIRSVLGMITKAYSGLSGTSEAGTRAAGNSSRPQPAPGPSGGELKKDPVCGTFISPATAFQKHAGGQTYYFCSTECRDKFKS